MGFLVVKDGVKMAARDNNQLAAFLNNGWALDTSNKPTDGAPVVREVASEVIKPVEVVETVEPVIEDDRPKRGRPRKVETD